jgi:hypothetical protein
MKEKDRKDKKDQYVVGKKMGEKGVFLWILRSHLKENPQKYFR